MSDLDAEIADLELSVDLMDLEDLFGLGDDSPSTKTCNHCGENLKQPRCKRCYLDLQNERERDRRKSGKFIARYILRDSRKSDKKKGRENDLTLNFIDEEIAKGCQYCGRSDLKINLDRIDNSIGHLRYNCKAACIQCNFLRRDMPYEAWKILVPKVRIALEKGLFGTWVGCSRWLK